MSTLVLANKLMSVKLDRAEVAKIKILANSISNEKLKTLRSLEQIITKQISQRVCRLCLTPGCQSTFADEKELCHAIKYAFGIEIREDDGGPQHICSPCRTITLKAARLKKTAEITQWRLQQELELLTEDRFDVDESLAKPHGGFFCTRDSKIVRQWGCSKCSRTFHNQEEFTQHELRPCRQGQGPMCVCEVCGQTFQTLFLLQRHRLTHTNTPGEFQCDYCPFKSRTKHGLSIHARGHTGDRPAQCPVCSKTFPSAASLWAHKRRHLPPSFHCDICGKGFRFRELLQEHISCHSNEKSFHCSSCGKAYATRKKVLRHERIVHNRRRLREPIHTRDLPEQSAG